MKCVRESWLMITFLFYISFYKKILFYFLLIYFFYSQRLPLELKTVLGYTEYLLIRPVAPVIGSAGTVLLPSNNVHSLCSIMMFFTLVIGPIMFLIAKSTVSSTAYFLIVFRKILQKLHH